MYNGWVIKHYKSYKCFALSNEIVVIEINKKYTYEYFLVVVIVLCEIVIIMFLNDFVFVS